MKKLFVTLAIAGLSVLSIIHATTITENFPNNPSQDGWQIFGDTNLFQWDSANQNLDVTWDSTQPNSYFYLPLGKTLTKADSFCVQFDLQLSNATAYGFGFELAIGLLHLSDATNTDFSRSGGASPNLFEFDYFPPDQEDDPYSIDATLKDSQAGYSGFYFAYDNLPLNPGVTYRVTLTHSANSSAIRGIVLADGQPYTFLQYVYDGAPEDFSLDAISINNFTDDGFGDSIFAQGTVDNLTFASPLPVEAIQNIAPGQIQFCSDTNWLYTLEQSSDLQNWCAAATPIFGNGTNLVLQATNLPPDKSFYRVRADLP